MTSFPYSISLPNSCSILVGIHLLSPNVETKIGYFQESFLEVIPQRKSDLQSKGYLHLVIIYLLIYDKEGYHYIFI